MTDPNTPDQSGAQVPPVPPAPPAYGAPQPAAPQYQAPSYQAPPAPAYGSPGYGTSGYGAPTQKTNTLAIVSLVASLAGLVTGLGFLVGIVCGHISLSQIKKTGEQGRGMALAGLIVGYIGVVITIILTIALVAWVGWVTANYGTFQTY